MKRMILLVCAILAAVFAAGALGHAEAAYRVDTGGNDSFTGLAEAYRAGDEVTAYFDLILDDADIRFLLDGE